MQVADRLDAAARRHAVAFEGGTMAWREFGSGAPLVLLHGGHGSWLHWARNIPQWSSRRKVLVPDLPGYGDSSAVQPATLDVLVGAICSALDSMVGPAALVTLVGFSFGALVAAHIAARRAAVDGMLLIGPAGHGGERRPTEPLKQWRGLVPDGPEWMETMRHNLLMHMLHDPAAVDATALHIHGQACLRTRFRSKDIARAPGVFEQLARYGGPCTILVGEHDVTCIPAQLERQAAAQARPVPVRIVPGAGHWAQYEQAHTVNETVLAWLASLDNSATT